MPLLQELRLRNTLAALARRWSSPKERLEPLKQFIDLLKIEYLYLCADGDKPLPEDPLTSEARFDIYQKRDAKIFITELSIRFSRLVQADCPVERRQKDLQYLLNLCQIVYTHLKDQERQAMVDEVVFKQNPGLSDPTNFNAWVSRLTQVVTLLFDKLSPVEADQVGPESVLEDYESLYQEFDRFRLDLVQDPSPQPAIETALAEADLLFKTVQTLATIDLNPADLEHRKTVKHFLSPQFHVLLLQSLRKKWLDCAPDKQPQERFEAIYYCVTMAHYVAVACKKAVAFNAEYVRRQAQEEAAKEEQARLAELQRQNLLAQPRQQPTTALQGLGATFWSGLVAAGKAVTTTMQRVQSGEVDAGVAFANAANGAHQVLTTVRTVVRHAKDTAQDAISRGREVAGGVSLEAWRSEETHRLTSFKQPDLDVTKTALGVNVSIMESRKEILDALENAVVDARTIEDKQRIQGQINCFQQLDTIVRLCLDEIYLSYKKACDKRPSYHNASTDRYNALTASYNSFYAEYDIDANYACHLDRLKTILSNLETKARAMHKKTRFSPLSSSSFVKAVKQARTQPILSAPAQESRRERRLSREARV